ncbi:MAG: hypothetical protein HZA49_10395 [Planctomycetes bacterium]|nr:hypothetical protein [Planctomycetota bacterium]
MKSSTFKSRLPKPAGGIKPKEPKGTKPDSLAGAMMPASKYPKKMAVVFSVCHVIFAIIISLWNFHPYIITPNGLGYFVYMLELPSAIIVGILGGANSNISPVILYIGAFLINTVFYGFFGYLIGYVLLTYGWDKEINRLCKLETEAYEETPGA